MTLRSEHIAITRRARLFTLGEPHDIDDLWIVCHGYAQLAERFIQHFATLEQPHRLIVAPEGLHRFYLDPPPAPARDRRVGATWMTREDREIDIDDYVAYLDAVVERMRGQLNANASVRALGFSQGTATVMRWATVGKHELDEIVLWSGEVPEDVDLSAFRQRQPQVRVAMVMGAADQLAPKKMVRMHGQRLSEAGVTTVYHEHPGGHHLDADLLADLGRERNISS